MPKVGQKIVKQVPICVACGGSGINSLGNSCRPCDGTGKQKVKKELKR